MSDPAPVDPPRPDLAELRALLEAAGDGPWTYSQDGMGALCYLTAAAGTYPVVTDSIGTILLSENAALIVAMHAAMPTLLDRLEALEAALLEALPHLMENETMALHNRIGELL